uniref:CRC domain-containing protein n=1 Tax=Oryza rufipogon TaxID=4529 RepID=A0A0E0P5E4_ORYRU
MGHARLHFLLFLVSASADCLLRPPLRLRRTSAPLRMSKRLELVCECLKHEVRCTAKCRCIECGNGLGIKRGIVSC